MDKNSVLSAAWDGLKEAVTVVALASLAAALLKLVIGEEDATAAYRAMLGAYLVVLIWGVVAEVRKALQGDGE